MAVAPIEFRHLNGESADSLRFRDAKPPQRTSPRRLPTTDSQTGSNRLFRLYSADERSRPGGGSFQLAWFQLRQLAVAMGARGATASSEAADAVIVVDRLDRVAEALLIARRARHIAVQSVMAGMALSGFGMVLATFGVLPPVAGAIFQEAIDVAVILNALRALGGGELHIPEAAELGKGTSFSSLTPQGEPATSERDDRVPAGVGR
jgi:hypothetical protein